MRISDWSSDVCSSDLSTRPRADNSPGQWGPDERLHALRLCPLFRYWPETRLVEVAAIARARSYARGTDVAAHRRDVIVVAAGGLEISSGSAAGAEQIDKIERSEEHTSELQALMRISYAVFCLNNKRHNKSAMKMKRTETNATTRL